MGERALISVDRRREIESYASGQRAIESLEQYFADQSTVREQARQARSREKWSANQKVIAGALAVTAAAAVIAGGFGLGQFFGKRQDKTTNQPQKGIEVNVGQSSEQESQYEYEYDDAKNQFNSPYKTAKSNWGPEIKLRTDGIDKADSDMKTLLDIINSRDIWASSPEQLAAIISRQETNRHPDADTIRQMGPTAFAEQLKAGDKQAYSDWMENATDHLGDTAAYVESFTISSPYSSLYETKIDGINTISYDNYVSRSGTGLRVYDKDHNLMYTVRLNCGAQLIFMHQDKVQVVNLPEDQPLPEQPQEETIENPVETPPPIVEAAEPESEREQMPVVEVEKPKPEIAPPPPIIAPITPTAPTSPSPSRVAPEKNPNDMPTDEGNPIKTEPGDNNIPDKPEEPKVNISEEFKNPSSMPIDVGESIKTEPGGSSISGEAEPPKVDIPSSATNDGVVIEQPVNEPEENPGAGISPDNTVPNGTTTGASDGFTNPTTPPVKNQNAGTNVVIESPDTSQQPEANPGVTIPADNTVPGAVVTGASTGF